MHVRGGLQNLITPRWIFISVWWDAKHPSQSTDALAANRFNEYILFWPFSGLFFVFHIGFPPSPHYSLSVLDIFCVHPLPFHSLSHPAFAPSFYLPPFVYAQAHLTSGYFLLPAFSAPSSTPTVKASITSSKMELICLYSETSHIQVAKWSYQNNSRQLRVSSNGPGSISTMLPMPVTSDVVGNYTCTLQLKNGQTISATQAVTLPYEGGSDNMVSQQTASFLFSSSIAYYNKGVLANFLSNQWRECTLNADDSSCVLSEVHPRQHRVSSSASEPVVYREKRSWQIPCFVSLM